MKTIYKELCYPQEKCRKMHLFVGTITIRQLKRFNNPLLSFHGVGNTSVPMNAKDELLVNTLYQMIEQYILRCPVLHECAWLLFFSFVFLDFSVVSVRAFLTPLDPCKSVIKYTKYLTTSQHLAISTEAG